jgi:hypothetical protein
VDDGHAESDFGRMQLGHLFVEAQRNEILLDLVHPTKLFVEQDLEIDRVHHGDCLRLPFLAQVVGRAAVHEEEQFIVSESRQRLMLVELMKPIVLFEFAKVLKFVCILLIGIELLLQPCDFLWP